ncbi:energy transducer TonB [Thermomonas sp.]|uniref:energy transducer TonB n=1 Tax=Thermomonas sp. TaxID=1971895 RepID=UPI0026212148|nr:energy transducer TonB [Thermomonas sp.]
MIHAITRMHASASGFALIRPASAPRPQASRIIAMSSALALNLLLGGVIMLPISLPPPVVQTAESVNPTWVFIPKPKPIEMVPIEHPRPVIPPRIDHSVAPPRHDTAPVIASSQTTATTGTLPASETPDLGDSAPTGDIGASFDPAPVQLAYRSAPPPAYPRAALRRGLGGTVLLRVLVGIDGRPLEVTIDRSSGFRELDEAARAQVLARWLFQPATRDGRTVQAVGLVPITFAAGR